MVVQTADTTFQGSWGLDQHASLSAVRAVESGRPVLQAALSGTSAAFDARGRRLAWAPGDWRGAAVVELPRRPSGPPMSGPATSSRRLRGRPGRRGGRGRPAAAQPRR